MNTNNYECLGSDRQKLPRYGILLPEQLQFRNQQPTIRQKSNNRRVAAFVRLDRGKEYTDHHSIFFLEKEKTHDHHASFEVVDFDHQLIAHEYLLNKGYKVCVVYTLNFALVSAVV
jgi:hypothetical protein